MKYSRLFLALFIVACGGSGVTIPPPTPDPIAAWGDSFTAGTGATVPADAYPAVLGTLLSRTVFNGGKGGETSTQIVTRLEADPTDQSDLAILWVGRNNYTDPTTVKADVASAVAYLTNPGHHFVILPIFNGSYGGYEIKGGAGYNMIMQLNGDLQAAYPNNFVDIRAAVVAAYDPNIAQDVTDHTNDTPPSSLRFDALHLKSAGYAIVARTIADAIKQKGW